MSENLTFGGSYAYGIVENVLDDTIGINRVQVRLFAIHSQDKSELPTENLPWCQVLLPTTGNEASSHGIKNGMCVKCSFLDGVEMQIPVVEGILPGLVDTGTSVTGNSDKTLSKYADGRNVTKKEKLDSTQPADPFAAKYPDNWVFETKAGHRIEVDDSSGAERIHLYHKTGSNTEFHPDGSVVTAITKDEYTVVKGKSTHIVKGDHIVNVDGKETIKVKGDISVETDGNLTSKVKGNASVDATGNVTAKAGGNVNVQAGGNINQKAGGNITIQAGGVLTLNGAQVLIG